MSKLLFFSRESLFYYRGVSQELRSVEGKLFVLPYWCKEEVQFFLLQGGYLMHVLFISESVSVDSFFSWLWIIFSCFAPCAEIP